MKLVSSHCSHEAAVHIEGTHSEASPKVRMSFWVQGTFIVLKRHLVSFLLGKYLKVRSKQRSYVGLHMWLCFEKV